MKTIFIAKVFLLSLTLQVFPAVPVAQAAVLGQVEFATADKTGKLFLRLTSTQFLQSHRGQIFSFKDAELRMGAKSAEHPQVQKIKFGYVDLESHNLVILDRSVKGSITETTINLESFRTTSKLTRSYHE